MRNLLLITSILVLSVFSASAQLKVYSNGYVGIYGAEPVGYPLGVKSYYGQIIRIDPSSSTNKSIIGSSTDAINFWYSSTTGFNKIYAQSYSIGSDSTIKKNIKSLPLGALKKVNKLRPVTFDYKDESTSSKNIKDNIGLIAQEVEKLFPEVVTFNNVASIKMINYDMLIPVLIKAIQEQQTQIEELQKDVKLNSKSGNTYSPVSNDDFKISNPNSEMNNILNEAILYQNTPNPFSKQTEIKYSIPSNVNSAYIYIFDMQGKLIDNMKINSFGEGFINIDGYQYDPGMYLYSLIIDGVEVDTKRMILTN